MTKNNGPAIPWSLEQLVDRGEGQVYRGKRLREVAFPLGGIGTGTISLGGCGQLRDFEIFNQPNKNTHAGVNLFTIWTRAGNDGPVARVLETWPQGPRTGAHGFPYTRLMGLPRMDELEFVGEYPIARVGFRDATLPLRVELEAFNPFIPLDPDDSGLPAAVFLFHLHNPTRLNVRVTLAGNFTNLVGWDGSGDVDRHGHPSLGGNVTRFSKSAGVASLQMSSEKYEETSPAFGTIAVASPWKTLTSLAPWPRGGWWDPMHHWWDDFAAHGRFSASKEDAPSEDGRTDVATLGLTAELRAGQSVTLPFVYAWHFPNRRVVNPGDRERGQVRNHYATRFADAYTVASYVIKNFERLHDATRRFRDVLFASTLGESALGAASSQLSTIRSNTCLRTDDGAFHAYEGCSPKSGCCPMNCTHVWNYEQSLAFLFPTLERTMREVDFLWNTRDDGAMTFRTTLPKGSPRWDFEPAADGQMGSILKLYREWKLGADRDWIERLWPAAKKALAYAWNTWDADRDGVMEGSQHHTYDINFLGANAMVGTLYLAALRAAVELAEVLRDTAAAAEFRGVADKGEGKLDRMLFNGSYYVQKYDPDEAPRYQFGSGCLSDQLLGQWFASVVGLGHVLPADHVRTTLRSIFVNNWKRDLGEHANVQRVYAMAHEAGLLLCTWPQGGRPEIPFPYSDEVWTGIEYQVAAHLIHEGMVHEGLAVAKAARSRHDGRYRNPWNEPECGDHYARALSSWSLVTALSGFESSVPDGRLRFAPRVHRTSFRSIFSAGTCWGSYSQRVIGDSFTAEIVTEGGDFRLRTLELGLGVYPGSIKVAARDRNVPFELDNADNAIVLRFDEVVTLGPGNVVTVTGV